MSTIGYGPPERIDGPPPVRPMYGLLQAAEQPAAGVRIVTDVQTETAAADLVEARERLSGATLTAAANDAEIEAAIREVENAVAVFERASNSGVDRWINGVQVFPYPPYPAKVWDACAPGSEYVEKDTGGEISTPLFGAFTVYEPITCTSYRVWSQEEFKARAIIALSAVESAAIAREFLTGEVLGNNPHLSDGQGTFPNADTATSPLNALALLEGEIADSGKLGLIHMSPKMATTLRAHLAIDDRTGVVRTINGNVIIPDAGYNVGSTPNGHAAPAGTEEWLYATGPVDIRRSEIFTVPDNVAQALERGTGGADTGNPNSITYLAERYYLVDWDTTVQAAVLADRCQTTCT